MLRQTPINLGRALLSLSDALDLCSPKLATHQMRCAYIAMEMGRAMKLPEERVAGLFMTASLHDVGALNTRHKTDMQRGEAEEIEGHARIGEILFRSIPLLRPHAPLVRLHHTPITELDGGIGQPHVLDSQIIQAADTLERLIDRNVFILHQSGKLAEAIRALSGTTLHPDVVDTLLGLASREEFWLDIVSPRLYSLLLHGGPYHAVDAKQENMRQIAQLFRHIIDFRSHFTATHSTGVAHCAMRLAALFGLSESEVGRMEIAGSFHDLGKLVVPNEILEKPGGLLHDEFAVVRQHTYWTFTLMNSIGGFEQEAEWAAFHHERLDGGGYPFHLTQDKLSAGSRIMAVADVATAIMEDRPYRKGMNVDEVRGVITSMATRGLIDANIAGLFLDNYREVWGEVRERQAEAMAFYLDEIEELDRVVTAPYKT